MIATALDFAASHSVAIELVAVVGVFVTAMHLYGRRLERRMRERGQAAAEGGGMT